MKTTPTHSAVNWIRLPDPIGESEVSIDFGTWTADERTGVAHERQAALMGFSSPTAYIRQIVAATLASNEEDTIVAADGRLVSAHHGYDKNGVPRDV